MKPTKLNNMSATKIHFKLSYGYNSIEFISKDTDSIEKHLKEKYGMDVIKWNLSNQTCEIKWDASLPYLAYLKPIEEI